MGATISFCDPNGNSSVEKDCFLFFGHVKKNDSFLAEDDFRHNLIRRRRQNVLDIYSVVSVLGKGSMGSVTVVRKRKEKIGGSARTSKFQNKLILPDSYHGLYLSDSHHCQSSYFSSDIGGSSESITSRTIDEVIFSERTNLTDSESVESETGSRSSQKSSSQNLYALKTINAKLVGDKEIFQEMLNEIEILRHLDHPNIVRALEVYEGPRRRMEICIIMDMCTGGDLYSRDPYTEKQAAKIVNSILSAVEYMHNNSIIHRDLKFENILFENSKPDAEIKIIDFGLSKRYTPDDPYQYEGVGTVYTMAPQVLEGIYDKQCDLWSIGVIAYMLMCSSLPFHGRKRRHIVKNIMRCNYNFKGHRWKSITYDAKKFISKLLLYDPTKRMTAREALHSEWLKKQINLISRKPSENFMDNVLGSLSLYSSYGKFKKLSLMVIAQKLSLDDISYLRRAFGQYDIESNGEINKKEFKEALLEYNLSDDELDSMFDAVDVDQTGMIHFTEFLAGTLEMLGVIDEEKIAEAFDSLDSDNSGFISPQNIREFLGKSCTEADVRDLMAEADVYKDNQISYEEFLTMFQDQCANRKERVRSIISRKSMEVDDSSSCESLMKSPSSSMDGSEEVFKTIVNKEQPLTF